ncbi:MAG: CDP-diacylglycerol--glycerol-3-phosphate 3-phosphatidyltransferase [Candidatus Cloacimonetes bacterium]|nr:CDP-diacylglycerol--glycerol-3-phosphate 3-phosphatidyltransferase [Candidatus Cloacimonadota bacterium]
MNLAIQITLFRIVLAPFFVYCFMKGVAGSIMLLWISLMIATVSEISDALDGILARRLNLVTDMGKVLDPLADSLSRMSAFLAFCGAGLVPVWMILVFFYRDSFVSTLRTLAASQNLILGARNSGKIKAIVQAVCIFGVILSCMANAYSLNLGVSYTHLIDGFMLSAVLITAYSLWDYIWGNRQILSRIL